MDKAAELEVVRRAYAKQVLASVGVKDPRVEAAFAAVPREHYLGPGPWRILRATGYVPTPEADPVYLYDDVLIGILPEQGLNNGMPSYHAPLIASASLQEGAHVVHIGAGVGYYTAIMAQLVGSSGKITAFEFDGELAARATCNFAGSKNVRVVHGDGAAVAFDPADVIYVNAGATRPADRWLDGLTEGGRLLLPLTAKRRLPPGTTGPITRHGAVFRIERRGADYFAKWISAVGVYPCEGGCDEVSEAALDAALQKGGWRQVTRLYRSEAVPEASCWLRAPGWCLAYT